MTLKENTSNGTPPCWLAQLWPSLIGPADSLMVTLIFHPVCWHSWALFSHHHTCLYMFKSRWLLQFKSTFLTKSSLPSMQITIQRKHSHSTSCIVYLRSAVSPWGPPYHKANPYKGKAFSKSQDILGEDKHGKYLIISSFQICYYS
jgi:hypothetical protein